MSLSHSSVGAVSETIHGVQIRDPYRWLEYGDHPQTRHWLALQQARCDAYFADCDPTGFLKSRVESLLDIDTVDQAVRVRGIVFYRRRAVGQQQFSLYMREAEGGSERVLLDSSRESGFTSLGIHRVSSDGRFLAIEAKRGGTDTKELRILDASSGQMLPGVIANGYARGMAFTPGGYYFCHEQPHDRRDHTIHFRSLESPGQERVVFTRPREAASRLILIASGTQLGALWVHEAAAGRCGDFYISDFKLGSGWRSVFRNRKLPYSPILHGGRIFVISFENSPQGKIVEITPVGEEIKTVVPESTSMIRQVVIAGGHFFVNYVRHGSAEVQRWTTDGSFLYRLEISSAETVYLLPQLASDSSSLFFTQESYGEPAAIFEHFTSSGRTVPLLGTQHLLHRGRLRADEYSFRAHDGASIPLTVVSSGHGTPTATRPFILTGYGGFGVTMTPRYSVLVTVLIELGFSFALAHTRGGGEFGASWHEAGKGRKRQAAISDFVEGAEWLCSEKLASPAKLGIFGGSNSGLLVGAALTQRPGLFRAVLCIAPLLDMVRYEHFGDAAKWQSEYGTAADPEDFRALYGYSPYHHVRRNVDYPSTLFVSGAKDERCSPAHVCKMVARLQERAAQIHPIILDYSAERGHAPTLPLAVRVDALTRRIAFLCHELGIELPREVTR